MDMLQIVMTPFSWLLETFCKLFNSYGIALILFTVVVKIILFPLSLKGKKGMIRMSLVSSQVREIQKRCGNDRERYNRELQAFYAKNKVGPNGGCLWSFLPLLILMPLYAIIRRPFRYLMSLSDSQITSVAGALGWEGYTTGAFNELTLSSMLTAETLGAVQTATGITGLFTINFMFLGLDLSQVPNLLFWKESISWQSVGLFIMPIISAGLSVLSMIVSQRTNRMNRGDSGATSQSRSMMFFSPLISLYIGYTLPAGLCIYWIANSLLMMVQEVVAGKILKKDYEAAQKEMEEQQRKAREEEKERRRIAAERKAAAIAAGTYKRGKQSQQSGKEKGLDLTASREGIRAYARGRAYDPNRYPITPYWDPNEPLRKKRQPKEDPTRLTEEEKELLKESGIAIPEEKVPETEAGQADTPAHEVQDTPAIQTEAEDPAGEAPAKPAPDGEGPAVQEQADGQTEQTKSNS